MIDHYFLSVTVSTHAREGNVFGSLRGVERPLWRGRAGLAEYAFDRAASQPRWALPEATELMVTDQRVLYAHTRSDSPDTREVISGELRWTWPQHVRVQPGDLRAGRSAATTQVQLVCAGPGGTWPALVFAGGDLRTVADSDKVANLIRQAIARFRLDNASKLGLTTAQSRLLSRLVIGPEFTNYQGGPGQTVSILGALPVTRATETTTSEKETTTSEKETMTAENPAAAENPAPVQVSQMPESPTVELKPIMPVGEGPTRMITVRPGLAADLARAQQAAEAEAATHETEPEQASRAADLAARVADLVSRTEPDPEQPAPAKPRHARPTPTQPVENSERFQETTNLAERAEALRRINSRLAANSGRHKTATNRRTEQTMPARGTRPGPR
jgi:hypothetical protein